MSVFFADPPYDPIFSTFSSSDLAKNPIKGSPAGPLDLDD
jgi:site-specific DNA-adenine methylase